MSAISDRQHRNLDKIIPLMIEAIRRRGCIMPVGEATRMYGTALVQYAISRNIVTSLIINRVDKDSGTPTGMIKAIYIPEYNHQQPAWLAEI